MSSQAKEEYVVSFQLYKSRTPDPETQEGPVPIEEGQAVRTTSTLYQWITSQPYLGYKDESRQSKGLLWTLHQVLPSSLAPKPGDSTRPEALPYWVTLRKDCLPLPCLIGKWKLFRMLVWPLRTTQDGCKGLTSASHTFKDFLFLFHGDVFECSLRSFWEFKLCCACYSLLAHPSGLSLVLSS